MSTAQTQVVVVVVVVVVMAVAAAAAARHDPLGPCAPSGSFLPQGCVKKRREGNNRFLLKVMR